MKHPKTLVSTGKTKEKAMRQAKRWFLMNPNRHTANVKLSVNETILIKREDII